MRAMPHLHALINTSCDIDTGMRHACTISIMPHPRKLINRGLRAMHMLVLIVRNAVASSPSGVRMSPSPHFMCSMRRAHANVTCRVIATSFNDNVSRNKYKSDGRRSAIVIHHDFACATTCPSDGAAQRHQSSCRRGAPRCS